MSGAPIVIEHVDHWYGEGSLRRQVLFDVSAEIRAGEIVILSGPSGSGKTTLLTLVGALRSTQAGSLRVLERELRGADERVLTEVRRGIGYVFQAHNLLDALTAQQNVEMGLQLHGEWSADERAKRAQELLADVGLGLHAERHPRELSGGERQRVAIARALAAAPRILLADEPTASLDRETGRGIVALIQRLARVHDVTVVLVTHDSRILDVADRILSLEDGRLSSFMSAVTQDTRHLWSLLARDIRQGELVRRVREIEPDRFVALLEEVAEETRALVEMVDLVQSEAFDSMLAQVLEAFAAKAREVVAAERTQLFLVDDDRHELFTMTPAEGERPRETRVPIGRGSAGLAAQRGTSVRTGASEAEPEAPPGLRHVLAIPFSDSKGRVFAVLELARAVAGRDFDAEDASRLESLAGSLAASLEAWFRMSCSCRRDRGISPDATCCAAESTPGRGGTTA
jgi:putative ABC transport system ATP-binding protein